MPASQHLEWLRLVDVSGPFLSPTVLDDRLTQGLLGIPTPLRQSLRQAHEEWRDAVDLGDRQLPALHKAWIAHVLRVGLDWSDRELVAGDDPAWRHLVEEHGVELRPDFTLIGSDRAPLAFVQVLPPDGDPGKPPARDRWAANAIDRMVHLCRAKQVRVGLITDGERWVVVNAPIGSTSGWAAWLARIWWQEAQTFQAFRTLLEVRRWFGPADQALPGLLEASAEAHDEITTTLGEQVRQAVEAIIHALDRLNRDQGGRLLAGVSERQLYEAGLTVMMRLVVLLCAEERGLLPVEEPLYQESYAISTLRAQLDALPDEVLERRHSAWSRILALVRGVYGGIAHDRLRLPALGGSIFDPDRYPFLEGRTEGSTWREVPAAPLLIDDRVVLYLLRSLQILERKAGAQLLSFRALDVEQIGHVYEGLLEHTVLRMTEPALGLTGSPNIPTPCVPLAELEAARRRGAEALADLVAERTGRQTRTIINELAAEPDAALRAAVVRATGGDADLSRRATPFAGLLRYDARGERLVYGKGSVLVTGGADRRETGSHYTPRHLAEQIAAKTLEPLCYTGPAEGHPREQWTLHAPERLLELKVCDPAMGSGAFLVAGCRYLAERLVESWRRAEDAGKRIAQDGSVRDDLGGAEPMPVDADERTTRARRLVAERCLYGVDINPVAVELAKISLWLVTWSKGRPFGFLDHRLKSGDSLLGITSLDQLIQLRLDPVPNHQATIFTKAIVDAADEAMRLRLRMSSRDIRSIADVDALARMERESQDRIARAKLIADAFIGAIFASSGTQRDTAERVAAVLLDASRAAVDDAGAAQRLADRSRADLRSDAPAGGIRRTFHWPLQFPEVFTGGRHGFDGLIGNPPFLGNRLWKGAHGEGLSRAIAMVLGAAPGKIDLCLAFHRRAVDMLNRGGCYGLLGVSNIAEGSAIEVGLGEIVKQGAIYFSRKGMPWPGKAAVVVAVVGFRKGGWSGPCDAEGSACMRIGPRLEPEASDAWTPQPLEDGMFAFAGVDNSKGLAFVIGEDHPWFARLKNERNSLLRPYITGDDITSHALQKIERYALDIADRSLEDIERNWPIAHRFLMEVVKPTRTPSDLKSYKGLETRWWQFWNHRSSLMKRIRGSEKCIVFGKATKYPSCMLAPSEWIYTNMVVLIEQSRDDLFAICLSSAFRGWLVKYTGGNFGVGLRISISESIETFPLPDGHLGNAIANIAREYNEVTVNVCRSYNIGITDLENLAAESNSPTKWIADIKKIRCDIDRAVFQAYGLDSGTCEALNTNDYSPSGQLIRFGAIEPVLINFNKTKNRVSL